MLPWQVKPSRGAEKAVVKMEAQIEAAGGERVVDVYEARSIDDALDLLSLTSSSSASASKETLERHPERRMKAAYTQYEERELPLLKVLFFFLSFFLFWWDITNTFFDFNSLRQKENPSLRHTQLKEILWKQWQKGLSIYGLSFLCVGSFIFPFRVASLQPQRTR